MIMKTVFRKPIVLLLMAFAMTGLLNLSSCSDDDDDKEVVDKSTLVTAIASANALIASTQEGVAEGNYLKGSQAVFQTAIDQAQAVVDNASATQAQVTAANANLAAALGVYQSKLVTPIDPDNLVGQWTFDELTASTVGTTVKDYSGNDHDGTIKAGPEGWGAGVPELAEDRYGDEGKALLFDDGANVEIPYSTDLNPASLTISAWVKLAEVRNNRFIGLHSWIGYKFEVQDANYPFATIGHSGGSYDRAAGVPITQDEWFHLVVTYKAGEMVFYINGTKDDKVQDATPNAAVSIAGDPYNLVLGIDFPADKYSAGDGSNFNNPDSPDYQVIPLAWGSYLHGYLDEVRIYKTALTAAQVESIYELEKP
jgi:hypothetical protein